VPFRHWPNITVVDKLCTLTAGEKKLSLVPWGVPLKEVEPCDAIFGHYDINGFKLNDHEVCTGGLDVNDFFAKTPLVVSGHYHLRSDRKYTKGTVLYVGSAYQLNFSDAETSKGFYIINTQDNTYEFVENNTSPKHFNIRLSELIQKEGIDDELIERFENNLIKLIIDRNICPEDTDFLINKLKLLKPAHFVVDYVTTFTPLNVNKEHNGFSGISIEQSITDFVELLEINNKEEVSKYVLDLYSKYK
jgi:DNA repair exonuclease SbcCD nuclease subunit